MGTEQLRRRLALVRFQFFTELLAVRMEDTHLDGSTEAEDVRSVLELIQSLTLEVSEELDTYQERYSGL